MNNQKLSLVEFRNYCDKLNPIEYVFRSDEQPTNSYLGSFVNPLRIDETYKSMHITLAPWIIYLSNQPFSGIHFNGVEYVEIVDDSYLWIQPTFTKNEKRAGVKFRIVCVGDKVTAWKPITYILVARKA